MINYATDVMAASSLNVIKIALKQNSQIFLSYLPF